MDSDARDDATYVAYKIAEKIIAGGNYLAISRNLWAAAKDASSSLKKSTSDFIGWTYMGYPVKEFDHHVVILLRCEWCGTQIRPHSGRCWKCSAYFGPGKDA